MFENKAPLGYNHDCMHICVLFQENDHRMKLCHLDEVKPEMDTKRKLHDFITKKSLFSSASC